MSRHDTQVRGPKVNGGIAVLLTIGIGILIVAYWHSPERKQNTRAGKLASAQVVSAEQLYSAYHDNEVAADKTYKGKAMVVVGEVWSNDRDVLGATSLKLVVLKQHSTYVRANLMSTEDAKSAAILRGFSVTLRCLGGGMVLGDPQLDECVIDRVAKRPPPATVTTPQ